MNLVMITKFYPYGTGEAFIENEIKVLANYYEKILIIACEVPQNIMDIREIPANVSIVRINAPNRKKGFIVDVIKGLKYLVFRNSKVKEEIPECKNILQLIFLCYFEAKSQRIFRKIMSNSTVKEIESEPYVLYSYWFFITARIGTLIKKFSKPIFMFTRAHRYDLYAEKNVTGYLPFRKMFLDEYNMIFPCSDNGTNYLKNHYKKEAAKVKTSFLGTLDHGIGRSSDDRVFRIVSCSRMEPVKRVSRIVDALALIEYSDYKVEWTHIGTGKEYKEIKKYAESKLKNIECIFLGDMKNIDVMNLYREKSFDLFLNVSSSEGLPVSIMEAISFGIPVIATDVGGTSEIVVNEMTGILIPNEFDDNSLSKEILKFIKMKDTSIYTLYRHRCRKFWEDNFQAIPNYESLCDLIMVRVDESLKNK